ncbi:MAG TPA: type II toxin-antitoxin system ParD family antitoxin [Methylocystis sp.]|nr:type II toxin-antitoxin system ParD family antitoxin [Methylocystis sp.]
MPSVKLATELEDFIESQIKSGRYRDASAVVSAGLRLLEDHEEGRAEREGRLAQEINEAFDEPGDDISADEVLGRIERLCAKDGGAAGRGA